MMTYCNARSHVALLMVAIGNGKGPLRASPSVSEGAHSNVAIEKAAPSGKGFLRSCARSAPSRRRPLRVLLRDIHDDRHGMIGAIPASVRNTGLRKSNIQITALTPARTSGYLDDRRSGLSELLTFAVGSTVFDAATNRGLIALEFGRRGAALVHGCDLYGPGIETAREIFKEVAARARFEVVDLSHGPVALEAAFAPEYQPRYDIVLFLGVYHHLRKQMPIERLKQLVHHLARKAGRFFACRTPLLVEVEDMLAHSGLTKVYFSRINRSCGPCGIWER